MNSFEVADKAKADATAALEAFQASMTADQARVFEAAFTVWLGCATMAGVPRREAFRSLIGEAP